MPIDYLPTQNTPCVATVGFFDGVHLGHQHLISQVKEKATALGVASRIITLDSHPRQVLKQDYQPLLLNTKEEKIALLHQTGVDDVQVLTFNEALSSLSAHDFMQKILHDRCGAQALVIGYDNRFGHNRTDAFDDYVRYGHEMGIEVIEATPLVVGGKPVSSSRIRRLLQQGDVEEANRLLGYDYTLRGTVVHGNHLGRTLGFPTANMGDIDSMKLIPVGGVYSVRVRGRKGMTNIGSRPTFYENSEVTVETHILDFNDDIYGEELSISFVRRLRDERRFSSKDDLIQQLHTDMQQL
ncbi:MAG: bifunctional riboflavin kinase/FAD synthetase [Prevotella sp.]|nr:bifunctional riboflavin kinase/FAD synthetase [Candidatus Equicola faecalis]